MLDYLNLFSEHVLLLQEARGLSKQELAELGGVSAAFVTQLVQGTANPTLKTMQNLAEGLGVPLSILLKPSNSEEWQVLLAMAGGSVTGKSKEPPAGYGYVPKDTLLQLHKIYVVEQWAKEARKRPARKSVSE